MQLIIDYYQYCCFNEEVGLNQSKELQAYKARFFSWVLALILTLLSVNTLALAPTAATTLDVEACKLPYRYANFNTLSFPRNPDRLPPQGEHRQLFLAVDFPDARYQDDAVELIERTIKPKEVIDFFALNSYGKVKMSIDIYPEIITLPNDSASYGGDISRAVYRDGDWSNDQIHKAALRILDQRIDLSKYSAISTLVTKGKTLSLTGGLASPWSRGFFNFKNGSLNNASLIGGSNQVENKDPNIWSRQWLVVVHEIGHLFGFIDLYMYNGESYLGKTLGPFDIMNGKSAPAVTAWNRWLMDWVTDSQIICLDKSQLDTKVSLSAMHEAGGTKAVVIRLSSTQLLVIESRRTSQYDMLGPYEGLLVYLVDMNVPTGAGAIRVIPEKNEFTNLGFTNSYPDSSRYISATLSVGEYLSYEGILIENLAATSSMDTVQISSISQFPDREKSAQDSVRINAEQALAQREAAINNKLFYLDSTCHPPGRIVYLQIETASNVWRDFAYAKNWQTSLSCPSNSRYQYWVALELPSLTRYRWKHIQNGSVTSYSSIQLSPQTQADAQAAAERAAAERAAAQAARTKTKSITCIKGKTVRKVKGVNPKCPTGFQRKR